MEAPTPPLSKVFPAGQATQASRPSFEDEEPTYLPPLRVKAPRPRQLGGTEFYGAVPKHSATFAWSELCATPDPEASLAPVPQVPMKSWYNSYVYVPEPSSEARQYTQRFARGPNGEWVDVVKARRLLDAMDAAQQKQMREEMEREMVLAGMSHLGSAVEADGHSISGIHRTHYMDPYSGEKLIACKGQLQTREEILDQYHIRGAVLPPEEWFDFDNLRFPWPFTKHDRNKPVSQHTYDWFDRRNVYIPNDRSCELVEMPSVYLERHELERWWREEPQGAAPAPMPQPRSMRWHGWHLIYVRRSASGPLGDGRPSCPSLLRERCESSGRLS
ncbi:unnamed protein product [Durusdinium trenchii]|uniref:Uncharacterized protein n=2 Tax=Durusdinium trenchii TaxID=1381693 RepID=A0ABP0HJF8_9DINO